LPPGDNPIAVNKYVITYQFVSTTLNPQAGGPGYHF